MMRLTALAVFCFATLAQTPCSAAAPAGATVEGVQMPAWVERNGIKQALGVGETLRSNDVLSTGKNARLLLRMAEGSAVKLGENGRLVLKGLNVDRRRKGLFEASLQVLEGAFRFTTLALQRNRPRNVAITIGTATAGIRGTDLWGKSASDKDIICLLEGKIEVTRGADAPVTLADPKTFYVAPRGGAAEPIKPVPEDKLAGWVKETDIQPATGAARRDGRWRVVAARGEEEAMFQLYTKLRGAGYAAELHPAKHAGKSVLNVELRHISSKDEAGVLAESLKAQFSLEAPEVRR